MTSGQVAALLATVGLAFLAQSIACTLLFRRVRALAGRVAAPPPGPGDWADTIRTIEARLDRLEARMAAPDRVPTPAAGEPKRARRLDRRQVASADGPVLIAVPSLAIPLSGPSTSTAEAAAELGRRFGGIWELADLGIAPEAIARQTGFPVGQVELILGLRRPGSRINDAGLQPTRDETDV